MDIAKYCYSPFHDDSGANFNSLPNGKSFSLIINGKTVATPKSDLESSIPLVH